MAAKAPAAPKDEEGLVVEKGGNLGPLRGPLSLSVRPLTVLVGRQGTGKSLVAQMLYLFRALPTLVAFHRSRILREDLRDDPKRLFRGVADRLRSAERNLANLTDPKVVLKWSGTMYGTGKKPTLQQLGFNAFSTSHQVNPHQGVIRLVEEVIAQDGRIPLTQGGIFIPAERIFPTMFSGRSSLLLLRAPLTLEVFSAWLDLSADVFSGWRGGKADTEEGRWIGEHLERALGGRPARTGSTWKWRLPATDRLIDLDMASSGQRANWPLMLLLQVLFSLRESGELGDPFTVYVEEPEIHLHPSAERAVIEVLAFLVNKGFRVVITTHSLTALYTLNNLLLAGQLPSEQKGEEIPAPEIRLGRGKLAAYLLDDGKMTDLVDEATGQIHEEALGRVADTLASEMNRIYARLDERSS